MDKGLKIEDFDVPNNMPNKLNSNKKKNLQILKNNKDKPFVKRVLNPDNKYIEKDGQKATHFMSAEIDDQGQAWVFPMIVIQDGQLVEFDDPFEAMEYNKSKDNAIQFKNIEEADRFSRTYKTDEFKEYYKKRGGE